MLGMDSMDVARRVVAELIAGGVQHVVLAPGSRSAPLVYALAEAAHALEVLVRIDERSAGFTALGLAIGSSAPVAIVTTSGTAVGNLLPAVMEANHAAVPLLVISADRPAELRGTGANQTTDQVDIFGPQVRFAADLPAGEDPKGAVLTGLDAAQGRLAGVPAGPVHLNLAFREPLTPALDGSGYTPMKAPQAVRAALETVIPQHLQPARNSRTVVLAGHGAGAQAELFARRHRLPLLAEPSSNARFGPNAVGPYRLLLPHFDALIERVVVFGRPTLSRPVTALLNRAELPRAIYLPQTVAWFEPGKRSEQIIDDWNALGDFSGAGPHGWLEAWQAAGIQAESALDDVLSNAGEAGLNGLLLARELWKRPANLIVGSSNPIRDLDLAARPRSETPRVHANRGLAGIDGTISTASGMALATGKPSRLLLGDLTFLHDAGGLLLPRKERVPDLQIVVLNDSGGGIFTLLEHGVLAGKAKYQAAVERFFGTAHDAELAGLAAAYGLDYQLISTAAELAEALQAPIRGRSVLEVRTERSALRGLHEQLRTAVDAAVSS